MRMLRRRSNSRCSRFVGQDDLSDHEETLFGASYALGKYYEAGASFLVARYNDFVDDGASGAGNPQEDAKDVGAWPLFVRETKDGIVRSKSTKAASASVRSGALILGLIGMMTLAYIGRSEGGPKGLERQEQPIAFAANFDGEGPPGEGEDRPVRIPAKPRRFRSSAGVKAPPRHTGSGRRKELGWPLRGGGQGGSSPKPGVASPAEVAEEASAMGGAPIARAEMPSPPPNRPPQPPHALPDTFRNLALVADPHDARRDVPLFWHISGGGVGHIIRNVLACRGAVLASAEGSTDGHGDDPTIGVVTVGGRRYVNVDTATELGLRRAKDLGLGSSGLADVVMTPLLHPAMDVFDGSDRRARAFTLLRDPVQRAVSTYLNLRDAGDPAIGQMSLDDYARSEYVESNWMIRSLTGKMDGELTLDHLEIAKELLRTRFVVGLLDDKHGSMARFERYFGWEYTPEQIQCRQSELESDSFEQSARQIVEEGGEAINLLAQQNVMDWQLMEFADSLYREQGALFSDVSAVPQE